MIRLAFLTWFLIALFSLRWFGIWYMNRPSYELPYGHARGKKGICLMDHPHGCYRRHRRAVQKTYRSVGDGFNIVGLAIAWPVLLWPLLALWLTPESDAELQERIKQAEAEVKRLEQEAESL